MRDPLPEGAAPWLLGLSLIAFSCTVLAELNPLRASVICTGMNIALACVYAEQLSASHTVITLFGLELLIASLITGVRALRARADHADTVERQARLLFEDQQQQGATEAERVRTDALLHDTVLAALLAAASNQAPERATSMAREALAIVSTSEGPPLSQPTVTKFAVRWSLAAADLGLAHDTVRFAVTGLDAVEVPSAVGDALVSAALQALVNSVKHAGMSTTRSVIGSATDGGGVRIIISDDGQGFDLDGIPEERLGVRVSILEQVRHVGGTAHIRSSPGKGTRVTLEWHPDQTHVPLSRRPGESLLSFFPRRRLYRLLGITIIAAVLLATADALFKTHGYASILSSLLGLVILPTLIRGAKRGTMSNRAAWITTVVAVILCSIAPIGLNPAQFDAASIARYTCGVLAGATMSWMAGRRLPPLIAVTALVTQMTIWAGPSGVIRLGLAGEITIVVAGLLVHRAIRHVTEAAEIAAMKHRDLTIQRTEQEAFNNERQRRLLHAGNSAAPMLHHIIATHGDLDDIARTECRILEQALRDEIRGRTLLNDAVRQVVSAHRRRGALVQVLDDGGLEGMPPSTLNTLLEDVARQLEPVRSSRIVIRTGQPESVTAITIVASTPDETAAALGLDADDEVDLWLAIPHPHTMQLAA
ncbi:histidine kinase/DNA gyrase B/HSP90-like ATPase [Frondihabitans sp. PhB188]|nr:histidine kinase/DNA gyrase B/HSP90-like ATPase [Frondihabitans sp. PhB188]